MLSGDIVIFGRDDKKRSVKGGGMFGSVIGGIAASKNEDKAVVVIDYRLIDAETSEVIATGEARGESVRKGNALGAIGGALGKGIAGVQIDMTSSNFAQTIIGEATKDCVNKLADILKEQSASMKKTVREVETSVADVSGNTLVIAAGGNDGVNVGEVFEVHQVVREVKDPTTKEVLDRITNKVGEMTITSVRDKIATGTYVRIARESGLPGPQENLASIRRLHEIQTCCPCYWSVRLWFPRKQKAMTIEDFDYSTVMTSVQAVFGTQMNIGQGIQAMLVKRVAEGGKFTIVERRKVGNIMKEQDFAASNRVKQGSGARIGQIRGADLTLMGDIVVFGRDDRKTSAGVGAESFRSRRRRDRRFQG